MKFMPASTARRMIGRDASSARTHGRQAVSPNPIAPSPIREILMLVRANGTYCINCLLAPDMTPRPRDDRSLESPYPLKGSRYQDSATSSGLRVRLFLFLEKLAREICRARDIAP